MLFAGNMEYRRSILRASIGIASVMSVAYSYLVYRKVSRREQA